MTTVLVTGANRGLGIEFVKQYSNSGAHVIACCRAPDTAEELSGIQETAGDRLSVHRLDVRDFAQADALSAELAAQKIDILINNAGIGAPRRADGAVENFEGWNELFETNVYAPIKISHAFANQVAASEQKKIVTISSGLGSIERSMGGGGGGFAYNASKAAVNRAMKQLAQQLSSQGIIVGILAPGWVRTDMGGPNAAYSPEESISGMRNVIERLTPETSGSFTNHLGESVPW